MLTLKIYFYLVIEKGQKIYEKYNFAGQCENRCQETISQDIDTTAKRQDLDKLWHGNYWIVWPAGCICREAAKIGPENEKAGSCQYEHSMYFTKLWVFVNKKKEEGGNKFIPLKILGRSRFLRWQRLFKNEKATLVKVLRNLKRNKNNGVSSAVWNRC